MRIRIRDEGINKNTDVRTLKYIHEQFLENHLTHTISIICDGMWRNKPVIDYINSTTNWDIAINGWVAHNYCNLSKTDVEDELDKCILEIEKLFGVTPEKWYLPYNGWCPNSGFGLIPKIADIAFYHGVDVDNNCYHISKFINFFQNGQKPRTNSVYFYSWDINDLMLLPELLFDVSELKSGQSCKKNI